MAVDYNDTRFIDVENEKNQALEETKNTYNQMINNSNSYYQSQIDASKEWADKQTELQKQQTDFAIEKVEQQKEQAKKDYIKEQKSAYIDYQKASNQYGVNAEKLAEQGLTNSGYSESTKTNMFNTYQNRYMSARESYNQAVLNYDNAIKEAQLANNSTLAQIAYEALQKQLELSLQGFQYNNTLVLQKMQSINETKDRYHQRYQDVLSQINTENALAEQIRQYNESMAFQKQEAQRAQSNWEREYQLSKAKTYSSGGSSKSVSSLSDTSNETLNNSEDSTENLSEKGKTALKFVEKTYTLGKDKNKVSSNAINFLDNQYQRGNITEQDIKIIIDKLNI